MAFPFAFASSYADWPAYQASQLPAATAVVLAIEACFTLATIVFALDYVREPAGRRRRSLFFVLLAFATHQAIDAAAGLLGGTWQDLLSGGIDLLGVAVAAAIVVVGARRTRVAGRRRDVVAFFLLVAMSAAAGVLAAVGLPDRIGLYLTMFGASRLLTASLMAYTLLRSNLLEIDLAIK